MFFAPFSFNMQKDSHPKMQVSFIFIVPVHPMIVVDAAGCRSAVLIAHFPFDTGSILSDTRIICFWRLPDFVPILLSFATEPELVLIPSQYPCEG